MGGDILYEHDGVPFGARDTDAAAQALLRELAIEAGGVGTFDWDLSTGKLRWDARLIELFGYDETTFDESIGVQHPPAP